MALTLSQRWTIADEMAKDVLPTVNANSEVPRFRENIYNRYTKRVLDICFASLVLIVTLPIHVFMAIATAIDLGRPLLFRQQRAGRNGDTFTIVKFRNMRSDRGANGDLLPPDQRVTRLGRFFRRTSLDELLNFVSVLTGRMSIIGPRPLPPEYVSRYSDRHRVRLAVRPGLECPPRDPSESRNWQSQFENDVWYATHVSFRVDLLLCWRLLRFTLSRKSSHQRAWANRGTFMGYSVEGEAINLEEVPQCYIDNVLLEGDMDNDLEAKRLAGSVTTDLTVSKSMPDECVI